MVFYAVFILADKNGQAKKRNVKNKKSHHQKLLSVSLAKHDFVCYNKMLNCKIQTES
jgi:hypothetical protein